MHLVIFAYIFLYCSNNADFVGATENEDNFGLDDYEPKFFHPLTEWAGYGKFQVFLKFDLDTDYTKDMFYFCHVSSCEVTIQLINTLFLFNFELKTHHILPIRYDDNCVSRLLHLDPSIHDRTYQTFT